MSAAQPFVATTTPNIERANRLIGVRAHPGFLDVLRLSQELVIYADNACATYPGWDPQVIVVLKVRMQAAREHHKALLDKIQEAIDIGIAEGTELASKFQEKTPSEVLEQGDYVREKMLEKFDEIDNRVPGSY